MIKLLVVSAMWKRPAVTDIFFAQLKELQQHFASVCDIKVLMVGSEGPDSRARTSAYGFYYIEHPNHPLANKWNAAMHFSSMLPWDYLLILGSDDLFSASALKMYLPYMKAGVDYIGLGDGYFFHIETKKIKWWPGYKNGRMGEPAGAGRCIKRRLMEQMNFKPFDPGGKRGLDGMMTARLRNIAHERVILKGRFSGAINVDIKSEVNIVAWERLPGTARPSETLMNKYFSPAILNRLYARKQN